MGYFMTVYNGTTFPNFIGEIKMEQILNFKERLYLQMASEGMTVKEIADKVKLPYNVVRRQIQVAIYRSQSHNTTEAVAKAIRMNLIPVTEDNLLAENNFVKGIKK